MSIWLWFRALIFGKPENPEDIHCPVCGYCCVGKGGWGCIDKPALCGYDSITQRDE